MKEEKMDDYKVEYDAYKFWVTADNLASYSDDDLEKVLGDINKGLRIIETRLRELHRRRVA